MQSSTTTLRWVPYFTLLHLLSLASGGFPSKLLDSEHMKYFCLVSPPPFYFSTAAREQWIFFFCYATGALAGSFAEGVSLAAATLLLWPWIGRRGRD